MQMRTQERKRKKIGKQRKGRKVYMKEVYQAERWPAREKRLWLEVMVRLEGATRSILEVAIVILKAWLTWLEIREEVLTDMMMSSN